MAADMKRMGSPIGARMVIDGGEVDYYCGTSYYTLHGDARVIRAAADAMRDYGLGPATRARVAPIDEVTDLACGFFETETVLYLISGYLGAMVLAQALSEDYDIVFVDDRSHYSVFDGVRSSGKRIVPFHHLDAEDLSRRLARDVAPKQVPLVMTDGVFPVTGAIAPLPDYASALSAYDGALLCTDDSHAVGVIGPRGQGTFEHHGLRGDGFHLAGTLSKAFGGIGGIIPGDRIPGPDRQREGSACGGSQTRRSDAPSERHRRALRPTEGVLGCARRGVLEDRCLLDPHGCTDRSSARYRPMRHLGGR